MNGTAAEPPRRGVRALLFAFAALTTVPLLAMRDLWDSDEPRYATIAREIVRDGDWVVLHLNQERYTEKPPLYFWCAAALGKLTGDVGPFAARLPSALAGAIGVVLCFELGRRLFDARIALTGALLLAATSQWWWISQRCALDAMLSAFLLAAMLLEEIGRREIEAGRGRAAGWWRTGAFAAAGAAFLVKGPPALVFFVVALVARAWAGRELRSLLRVPWLRGTVALAAVVALWGVPWVVRLGAGEVERILFHQTVGRMSESYAHAHPWHYYLRALPASFLPWSVAWLGIAWLAWRRRRIGEPARDASQRDLTGCRYVLAMTVACTVVFSFFSGKRVLYLLPLLPGLSLMTACALDRFTPPGIDLLRLARRAAIVVAGLTVAIGVVVLPRADDGFSIGPLVVREQSPRPLGELVRAEADAGRTVVLVDVQRDDGVLYYARLARLEILEFAGEQPVSPDDAHAQRLRELEARHGDRLSILVQADEVPRFLPLLTRGTESVARVACDRREYELLRLR